MPAFDPRVLLDEYGDETLVRDLAKLLVETNESGVMPAKRGARGTRTLVSGRIKAGARGHSERR